MARFEQQNPAAAEAIKSFFGQYGRIYEDERFKQLSAQIEGNKQILRELEMKQQCRDNIAKLDETRSKLDFDFQPIQVAGITFSLPPKGCLGMIGSLPIPNY